MKQLIESLEQMVLETTDTGKIGHMRNKLADIYSLYVELDGNLKEYEMDINDLKNKVKEQNYEINKLKKVVKVSLELEKGDYYE